MDEGGCAMSGKWKVFFVVAIGIFISTLDGSILNIANPTIASELGISIRAVQWVVTAYLLTVTSALLLFGRLGDRYGNHRVFTLGFLIFTVGSFLCSLAANLYALVAARIFQAIGGAMLMATGIALVAFAFPQSERGRALGLTGSVVGIGNVAGPALGGLIVTHFHWSVIFGLNIPIGLLGLWLGRAFLPSTPRGQDTTRMDFVGLLLFASVTISSVITANGILPWWFFTILLLLLGGFILWEKRCADSFVDKALLREPTFTLGNITLFIAYFAQMAALFLTPFYIENILRLSPASSGLIMALNPVALIVAAPLAGSASDKIGGKKIVCLAYCILCIAFFLFSRLSASSSVWLLLAAVFLLGAGMGVFSSPNNSEILGAVPLEKQGYGGGFIATVRNLGFAFGAAAGSSLYTYYFTQYATFLDTNTAFAAANARVFSWFITALAAGLLVSVYDLLRAKKEPVEKTPAKKISL
jgi:EmrB/QacA subfamily drug resistance transporter